MSTATELLRRLLEAWDDEFQNIDNASIFSEIRTYLSNPSDDAEEPVAIIEESDYGCWGQILPDKSVRLGQFLYLHPPKPAEPEAEYDLSEVIPLTHRKAKGIIKDRGYNVTGFVLTENVAENKCIVDMSAVRWLTGKEFFEMMHPVVTSPTADPEAEPVAQVSMTNASRAYVTAPNIPPGTLLYRHPPRPEPARKPMTEDEVGEEILRNADEWSRNFANGFVLGVRFAEKHHGISSSIPSLNDTISADSRDSRL